MKKNASIKTKGYKAVAKGVYVNPSGKYRARKRKNGIQMSMCFTNLTKAKAWLKSL